MAGTRRVHRSCFETATSCVIWTSLDAGTQHAGMGRELVAKVTVAGCEQAAERRHCALYRCPVHPIRAASSGRVGTDFSGCVAMPPKLHESQGWRLDRGRALDFTVDENSRPVPQELNLSWCQNLTSSTLVRIVEGCRYLKRLELWKCTQLDAEALEEVAAQCGAS